MTQLTLASEENNSTFITQGRGPKPRLKEAIKIIKLEKL